MPLEVRELIIRALVDPTKGKNGTSTGAPANSGVNQNDSWDYQKSLLDQLNKMLKKRKER